jgi:hypothetical protein
MICPNNYLELLPHEPDIEIMKYQGMWDLIYVSSKGIRFELYNSIDGEEFYLKYFITYKLSDITLWYKINYKGEE